MLRASPSSTADRFALTAKQLEMRDLLAGTATHCLIYGGSRSGKTFLLVRNTVVRACRASNSRHAVLRWRANHVRASVWRDTLPKVMRLAFPGLPYDTNESEMLMTLPNGATIVYGGLDDGARVDKILGTEYATLLFNECSQISHDAVVTVRSRLAQHVEADDGRGALPLRAYYDLNPVGKSHWTYREFVQGVDPVSGARLRAGSRVYGVMNPRDNPHLPGAYINEVLADMPERQRKRFLDGLYIDEIPGALWRLEWLEKGRRAEQDVPPLRRVVVAIDPSVAAPKAGSQWDMAECGIIVAGLGDDGRAYVLSDRSERLGPDGWARAAVAAYEAHNADAIIAEANNGGELVRSVLRTVDRNLPVTLVHASRGKITRAEPVSALYEQGRVSHVGAFPELEEQMTSYTGAPNESSPDRMDALVWAITHLMIRPKPVATVVR